MRLYKILNKYQSSLLIAFTISSVFLVLSQLCALGADMLSEGIGSVMSDLSASLAHLTGYIFCFFLIMLMSRGKRGVKAFWGVICLSLVDNLITNTAYGELFFFISLLIAVLSIFCFDKLEAWVAFIFIIALSLLCGFLLNFLDASFNDMVMSICSLITGKGIISTALFGFCEALCGLFGSNALLKPVFYNSYGGSYFIDGSVVTGAKDLFEAGFEGDTTSMYLSGHYFTLFLIAGMVIALSDELKGVQKITLVFVGVSALLSGNISLFALFIFFEGPMLFLSFSVINMICYTSAYLIHLDMGYLESGSFFELIKYINNPVYLIAGGIIFVCIGFFATRLVSARFGISDCLNTYIPTRLNRVVAAVGGITNIIKFKNGRLEVRNPELVNTLSVKCEINGSIISSDDLDFIELQDYL